MPTSNRYAAGRSPRYAELHCHSAFSFLDGTSLPCELAARAVELGYDALAITDHNSVSGSMEFAQAARPLGLKAIHGAEVNVTADDGSQSTRHITLLVESETGWRNLSRLLTRAHACTRATAGGISSPVVRLEDAEAHSQGLICLSGCADRGVRDESTMRRLLDAFGRDNFRIELQRPFLQGDRLRNRRLLEIARRLGVPTVATGNVHAHGPARALLQDVFVAVRLGKTLDTSEPERRGNHSHVLASPEAMAARFSDFPDAVDETHRLAERIDFDLTSDLGYRYPGAEDAQADRKLTELCRSALVDRYGGRSCRSKARDRLDEELSIVSSLGLSGFFLLHHEVLDIAREVALEVRGPGTVRALMSPGRGRGSSVSSIICYLTGLSHVDPVEKELFLGRFLHKELTALPDIDLDFPRDIRERLIPRIHVRFGKERSALVGAFSTYRVRGAVREIGKALGVPPSEIERIARTTGSESRDGTLDDVHSVVAGSFKVSVAGSSPAGSGSERTSRLAQLVTEAYGLPRHLSQHPGGMIISTRPLIDCCPAVPAAMAGRQVVQWDKDSCADAGFLKMDLLGLGMLSCVERTVEAIAERRGERIDLTRIPLDDSETFDAIANGDTVGVFQIESRAQMQSIRRTRPRTLDDLTVQVAIVRPGPIQGGAVNPYIQRLERIRRDPDYEVPYEHPSLEPALKETLGTIIFQDQVLEVAMALSGFTAGEAEGLRRAMSKKRSTAAMDTYRRRFIEGAVERGVDYKTADTVFEKIAGFSGFGFPKSHAAAFGLLAYQSTWLRVHYAAEFLCSLLNEQPMGFYPPDSLVHEAKRRGIEVLPPDITESDMECRVTQDGEIRLGLGYVKGVKASEVKALVAERVEAGPYTSVEDLSARVGSSRSTLERLAWSGVCDALVSGDRRKALWRLGISARGKEVPGGVQLSLGMTVPDGPELKPLDEREEAVVDYATTGVTARTHPMALRRRAIEGVRTSADIERMPHGRRVEVAGIVVARQQPATANGVLFMLLEDEYGWINLVASPEVYRRYRTTVRTKSFVRAGGRLERFAASAGAANVVVDRIEPLSAHTIESSVVRSLPASRLHDRDEAAGPKRSTLAAMASRRTFDHAFNAGRPVRVGGAHRTSA